MIGFFNRTHVFAWYMTMFVVKNKHQIDTCYDDIELMICCDIDIVRQPMVNSSGRACVNHLRCWKSSLHILCIIFSYMLQFSNLK